jgi:hypothetical protein
MPHSEDGFEEIIRDLWQHGSRRTLRFVKLGPRSGKDVVPGVNLFQPDIAIGAKQFSDTTILPLGALKSYGRRSTPRWKPTCACRRFPIEPSEGKSLTAGASPFFALTSAARPAPRQFLHSLRGGRHIAEKLLPGTVLPVPPQNRTRTAWHGIGIARAHMDIYEQLRQGLAHFPRAKTA